MINKLNYEEMAELRGDIVVGKHPEKGEIRTKRQVNMLINKINEIVEHVNKLEVWRAVGL